MILWNGQGPVKRPYQAIGAPGPGPCRAMFNGLATLALAGPRRPGRAARLRRGSPAWDLPLARAVGGRLRWARQGGHARVQHSERRGRIGMRRQTPAPKTHDPKTKTRNGAPAGTTGPGSSLARGPNQEGPPAEGGGGCLPRGFCSLPLVFLEASSGTQPNHGAPTPFFFGCWKPPDAGAGLRCVAPFGRSRSQVPPLRKT